MLPAETGFNLASSYAQLDQRLYTRIAPTPVAQPSLIVLNSELAEQLALDLRALSSEQLAALFSGNSLPADAQPLAQAYAGHQFGYFTMLGDGRAIVLGEQPGANGELFDIQLKGSGRTPYSRQGDGRAALAPMLREYLISEAMHALNIPSSRSLAVVSTGEQIYRDGVAPGAVLTRVASSHIRVGTFQYAATLADSTALEQLLAYTIERHYPHLQAANNPALALLEATMERQIDLVVHWMRVGFIHGVMNTDNTTISGESIDYGPCAFMDAYHPGTVFSSIDHQGRYAYANQPAITRWNLARFAEALLPLIDAKRERAIELAKASLDNFSANYQGKYLQMMAAKLGLQQIQDGDAELIADWLDWLQRHQADYTNSFLQLMGSGINDDAHKPDSDWDDWQQRWRQRLTQQPLTQSEALQLMRAHNPEVIPRNHLVEPALQAANSGDMQQFNQLLEALKQPYQRQAQYQELPAAHWRNYRTFCGT